MDGHRKMFFRKTNLGCYENFIFSVGHWLIFCCTLLWSSNNNNCLAQSSEIYVNTEVTSWSDANQQCNLFGIDRNSSEVSLTFTESFNNITGEFWIGGYSTYSSWLLLDGCYFGTLRQNEQGFRIDSSTDPVKTCMDLCPSVFSIDHDTCYCQGVADLTRSGCLADTSCGMGSHSFCGENKEFYHSSRRFTCMCLYRETNRNVLEGIGNCLTYYPLLHRYKIEECSKPFPAACRPGDSANAKLFYPELGWIQAGGNCYRNNHQFYTVLTHNTSVPQYWLSIFRRSYYKWGTPTRRQGINCLSVSINNESVVTHERKCQTQLPALCELFLEQTTAKYTTKERVSAENGTERNWTTIVPTTASDSNEDMSTFTQFVISTDHDGTTQVLVGSSGNIKFSDRNKQEEPMSSYTLMLSAIMSGVFLVIFSLCVALIVKRRQVIKKSEARKAKQLVKSHDHNMAESEYTQIDNIRNECIYNEVSEKPDGSFAIGGPIPVLESSYDLLEIRDSKGNAEPNPLYDHISDFQKDDGTYSTLRKHRKLSLKIKNFVDYDTLKNVRETLAGENQYQHLQENNEEKKDSVILREYDTLDNIGSVVDPKDNRNSKNDQQTTSFSVLPQQNVDESQLLDLKNNQEVLQNSNIDVKKESL